MDGLNGNDAGGVKQAAEEELLSELSQDTLFALKQFSLDKGLDVDLNAPTFRKVHLAINVRVKYLFRSCFRVDPRTCKMRSRIRIERLAIRTTLASYQQRRLLVR
jgi:hypothetical protein